MRGPFATSSLKVANRKIFTAAAYQDMRALGGITTFIAALCVSGAAGIRADECESFAISVHLQVDHSIASRVLTRVLEDETAGIWRPYGVRIEWTDAQEPEAATSGLSLNAIIEQRIEGPGAPQSATVLGKAVVEYDAPTRRPVRVSFEATES